MRTCGFDDHTWRGLHHHGSLCIVAYAFLLTERLAYSKKTLRHPFLGEIPAIPADFRVRGPLRRQRHVPDSITTLRLALAAALIETLPRCPCCGKSNDFY